MGISGVLWYVDVQVYVAVEHISQLGLNGDHYDILESPPSPVEFARICHVSRPVLIKGKPGGYCSDFRMKHETIMIAGYVIRSLERWSDEYLIDTMGDRPLSVAVTPNGLGFNIYCL